MRELHATLKKSDLVECFDVWRNACVDTKDLALHDRGNTKVVKDVGTVLPRIDVAVLLHGLVVEAILC